MLLALGGVALAERWLACCGLECAGSVRRALRGAWQRWARPGRCAVRPWSENPVAVREAARESRRIPWGFPGYLLVRYWLLWLCAGLVGAAWITGGEAEAQGLFAWFALLLLQPLRASLRTSGALVEERERGTLVSLILAGVRPREFADGWAQVGALPLLVGGSLRRSAAPSWVPLPPPALWPSMQPGAWL